MPTPREMMEAAQRRKEAERLGRPLDEMEADRPEQPKHYEPIVRGGNRSAQPERQERQTRARHSASGSAASGERRNASSSQAPERGRRERGQARRESSTRNAPRHGAPQGESPQREGSQRQNQRYVRSFITRWRMIGVTGFGAIMVIGMIIGLLFFARPTTSAVEMRNLTTFPEFTVESFLDGSYFTQISLWYADTYPLREPMVAADHAIDSLFGINTGTGMVGGNVKADEIPVEQEEAEEPVNVEPPAEPPDQQTLAEDIQENIMEGVYVEDGAGYAIYYFSQNAADTYITAMNTAADRLDGISTVYSIMAPANSITLDPTTASQMGGSDQQQTLDYLRTRFNGKVKSVEIVDDIIAHRDEYLYFHTDHHWTQLGAYYAYVAFCNEKGIEPKKMTSWREVDLGEFQGTYYDTIAGMGYVNPDDITAYVPNGTNDMTYWTAYGEEVEGKVIDEEAVNWDPSFKYSAFAAGDQALEIIHNPNITDGSSCLVVKDSYGCAFIPCLVDSYETIHVIDFRDTDKNICDYAKDNEIQDVIFLTGMKIGLTDTVAQTLLSEVS